MLYEVITMTHDDLPPFELFVYGSLKPGESERASARPADARAGGRGPSLIDARNDMTCRRGGYPGRQAAHDRCGQFP